MARRALPSARGRVGRVVPLLLAAAVGALVGVAAVAVTRSPDVVAVRVAARPAVAAPARVEGTWPADPTPTLHPTSFPVADARRASVSLHDEPGGPSVGTLANPTWEDLAVVFLVLEERPGWVRVRVSTRPNGRVAWVPAGDVSRRTVPNWIRVELAARRLTVFHGDTPLVQTTVGVGRASTPTPTGSFFVDGRVLLDPLHPAYGAGQVSVSGFSEELHRFGGGVGQIALHGTMAPALLGQETSNGCVRLDNDSIRKVVDLAPTGTPVEIVP